MGRRMLLILNPAARQAGGAGPTVTEALQRSGIEPVPVDVADGESLAEAVRRQAPGADGVIVGGGDGTLHQAIQAVIPLDLPLGMVPLGTANNVARTLEIPTDPEEACAVIGRGHRRRIDVGQVNDRYFLTTASFGLSVDITAELSGAVKRRWGIAAYAVAATRALWAMRPFHVTIEAGERLIRSRTVQVVVGNGVHYGSALRVADDARIDDGALDLFSLELRHWWQAVGLIPALKAGSHHEHRDVLALRGSEFTITAHHRHTIDADGELAGRTPARFRVVPGALEIFTPADA